MIKPQLQPTVDNTFIIVHPSSERGVSYSYDFGGMLSRSKRLEAKGEIEKACDMRYEAFQRLMEILPEGEEVMLEWENDDNQAAMQVVRGSAIDHFLAGDFEMAAAMMELLLELDPEDHLEVTQPLAYCYVALEEYELFDEIINDISDKFPEKEVLKLWSEFRRTGSIPQGELIYFRKSHPVFYREFTAEAHPVSPEYLQDIEGERPSKEALARELWLQTEHLWTLYPDFIPALRAAQ